jgi:hypothetical protein
MEADEPLPHNEYLYVFTPPGRVKISFKKDKDTGEKIIGLTQYPDSYTTLHIDLQAICFKRMIESDLCDMEYAT